MLLFGRHGLRRHAGSEFPRHGEAEQEHGDDQIGERNAGRDAETMIA